MNLFPVLSSRTHSHTSHGLIPTLTHELILDILVDSFPHSLYELIPYSSADVIVVNFWAQSLNEWLVDQSRTAHEILKA